MEEITFVSEAASGRADPQQAQLLPVRLDRRVLCVSSSRLYGPVQKSIERMGTVLCLDHALAARQAIDEGFFDGYVIDAWLPDFPGATLIKEIRKLDPHAPIVCYTLGGAAVRRRALTNGANAAIEAPSAPDELANRLEKLLDAVSARCVAAESELLKMLNDALARRKDWALLRTTPPRRRSMLEQAVWSGCVECYLSAGGTRASLTRSWPELFARACADNGIDLTQLA